MPDSRVEPTGERMVARALEEREANRAWVEAERIAQAFHEAYERQAPSHGYETRPESAVPWEQLPGRQHDLMVDTVHELLVRGVLAAVQQLGDAERGFLNASIAVWREIDALRAQPGGYRGLDSSTALRERERLAWERYRAVLDSERQQPEREGDGWMLEALERLADARWPEGHSCPVDWDERVGEIAATLTRAMSTGQVARAEAAETEIAQLKRKLTEADIDKHTAESLQRKAAGELTEAIKEREAAKRRAVDLAIARDEAKRELDEQKRINEFDRVVPIQELRGELERVESTLALRTEALRGLVGALTPWKHHIEGQAIQDEIDRTYLKARRLIAPAALSPTDSPEEGE